MIANSGNIVRMLESITELASHKNLILAFFLRDVKARYKQTYIGIGWAVLQPLVMTIVFTVIFSNFLKVSTDGAPYPIFSYIALAAWTYFSRVINTGSMDLIVNSGLIKKIYFPRETIPLSTVLSSLVDFCIAGAIFILLLALYRTPVSWHIVFVPLLFILQLILGTSLALLTSCLTIMFRDLRYVWPFLVQVGMYVSPVVYSVRNLEPKYQMLMYLNPMTGIIEGYRSVFLYNEIPDMNYFGVSVAFSIILLVISWKLFKKIEIYLADIV